MRLNLLPKRNGAEGLSCTSKGRTQAQEEGGGRESRGGEVGGGGSGVEMWDMSEVDVTALVAQLVMRPDTIVVFFVSTWEHGEPCHDARPFFDCLREGGGAARQFADIAKDVRYSICGLGSSGMRERE